jgi:hypothetical protein
MPFGPASSVLSPLRSSPFGCLRSALAYIRPGSYPQRSVSVYVTVWSVAQVGLDVMASRSEGTAPNCSQCYSTVRSACLKMEAMLPRNVSLFPRYKAL